MYRLGRVRFQGRAPDHYLYGGRGTARLLPATQVTVAAWVNATRCIGWTRKITKETPLWQGSWLREIGKLKGVSRWDRIGISNVGDVMQLGKLMSFATLSESFHSHLNQQFKYTQLRQAWQAEGLDTCEIQEVAPLEGRLCLTQLGRGRYQPRIKP